ncbi:MAG: class I SAM-dependent rRNA methyltransferase [Ignavibacteria bacterium]|nr:class I SAM-dependent rRNA methyltransferase [Ignavibacteria bacterium]
MPKVILKKNEDRRIKKGHLWIFSNEIIDLTENPKAGDVVDIFSSKNEFLGKGFYNPNTLITVRILTRNDEIIDRDFFLKRIHSAVQLRKKIFPERNSYRIVHGESDLLPGLVIDKYNNSYSIQVFSFGMEKQLDLICDIIKTEFSAEQIVLRNDFNLRELEGLTKFKERIYGIEKKEIIFDGKINFEIDLLNSQKTGFYFDQVENRHSIIPIAKDLEVLDCFCNDGGFSLSALFGGAKNVTAVDISNEAINNLIKNISLNNFDENKVNCINKDAFNFMKEVKQQGKEFDLVILDPPSFTKSKKNLPEAKKGYFVINSLAFSLVRKDGFIATSSCSHHLDKNSFLEIISSSALKSNKKYSILKINGASQDHPIHPLMPETEYLKFVLIKILE